jgi:uncharacterized protein
VITESAAADRIGAELLLIRENVSGVLGSIAATSDGFLVACDLTDVEPTQVAALVAALHSVALRTTLVTGCGEFRDGVTRGSDGYLAAYAAGNVIVAVIGQAGLNVGMLNFHARKVIARIEGHAADFARANGGDGTAGQNGADGVPTASPPAEADGPRPLPARHRDR